MKMPFHRMPAGEAAALARMAASAVDGVTCDDSPAMVVGLDSDMLPVANVNDARWMMFRFPKGGGIAVVMMKLTEAGLMMQVVPE